MLQQADKIDLDRYLGEWHEIASFPAWFQKGCLETKALYTKTKDDKIGVKNTCKDKYGTKRIAQGTAVPTRKANVLQVQFFPLIKSDYIIEFVDKNYRYAIVGSNDKRYLWILSRSKHVLEETLNDLVNIARKKGYDISKLDFK